jgi:hypothetical protein
VAARATHVDVNNALTVRLAQFSIKTIKETWAARFNLYKDQSQWSEYHGLQLWPGLEYRVKKRGRRQTKRLRGDKNGWGAGSTRGGWGNNLLEEARVSK